jgi:hypothetical protein
MTEMLFSCPEPGGVRIRRVRPMRQDPDELATVLRKVQEVRNLFGEMDCFKAIDNLSDPTKVYLLVDSVGILCVAPDGFGGAHVHITFWDRRLRGREGLCRGVAREIMSAMNLAHLWTAIPRASRAVLAFAKRVGFKETASHNPAVAVLLLPQEDFCGS